MEIASSFLALAISIDLPLAIVAIAFHLKKIKPANTALLLFNLFSFALIIGAIVNAIVAMAMYTPPSYYYGESIHECSWVALGLSLGGLGVSLAAMLVTFDCIRRIKRSKKQELYYQKQQERKTAEHVASLASRQEPIAKPCPQPQPIPEKPMSHNMDYIEEIRRLKGLFDCGAITQEEFDAKKKQLLS